MLFQRRVPDGASYQVHPRSVGEEYIAQCRAQSAGRSKNQRVHQEISDNGVEEGLPSAPMIVFTAGPRYSNRSIDRSTRIGPFSALSPGSSASSASSVSTAVYWRPNASANL